MVSIYNDDFAIQLSRPQYYIEVYRCVKVQPGECSTGGRYGYPVPKTTEEIEIVVPDIANRDRSYGNNKTFYKYVVYNHTSCQCGRLVDRMRKLYKTIANKKG